jgi:hypothetical protein
MGKAKEIKFVWNALLGAWNVIAILLVAKVVLMERGPQSMPLISWAAIYVQKDAIFALMLKSVLSAVLAIN